MMIRASPRCIILSLCYIKGLLFLILAAIMTQSNLLNLGEDQKEWRRYA